MGKPNPKGEDIKSSKTWRRVQSLEFSQRERETKSKTNFKNSIFNEKKKKKERLHPIIIMEKEEKNINRKKEQKQKKKKQKKKMKMKKKPKTAEKD